MTTEHEDIFYVDSEGNAKYMRWSRYIEKMKKAIPALVNWSNEDIARYEERIISAVSHVLGHCYCGSGGQFMDDEYYMPLEQSGEFKKIQCPQGPIRYGNELINKANFPKRHLSLEYKDLGQYKGKVSVQKYVNSFKELSKEGKSLLIAGGTGTGKTQLSVAVGVEICKKHLSSVSFANCYEYLSLIKQAFKDVDSESLISDIKQSDLLILDDVGASRLSEFDYGEITNLIDYYYREVKPIIITTNLNKTDLIEFLGERTVSRIMEISDVVLLEGQDRRTSHKPQK